MEIVKMLLKAGADPNIVGLYGTCLDVARAYNQAAILEVLQVAAGGAGKKKLRESQAEVKLAPVDESSGGSSRKGSKPSTPVPLRSSDAKVRQPFQIANYTILNLHFGRTLEWHLGSKGELVRAPAHVRDTLPKIRKEGVHARHAGISLSNIRIWAKLPKRKLQ